MADITYGSRQQLGSTSPAIDNITLEPANITLLLLPELKPYQAGVTDEFVIPLVDKNGLVKITMQ